MKEIIYFELNDWICGRDYPDAEPFVSWMNTQNYIPIFRNEKWAKENKLVIVESLVDMSLNYCIAASKKWVEKNCPELLTKYKEFLREEDEEELRGQFGCPFKEYKKENFGVHYATEKEDNQGFLFYSLKD